MPAPQGYVALDLVGFTDKGDYAAGTTYAQNDLVHSDNRIYLSLQDNNVGQALPVSPDTETEFWKLWLSGGGDDLEALTAEDTSNVTGGGEGQVVVAQTLIDAIANKVMNDLVAKSQIINNLLATQAGNVLDATQGKALKDEIDQLNSELVYSIPPSDFIGPGVSKEYGEITINTCGKIAFCYINALLTDYSKGSSINVADLPENLTPAFSTTGTANLQSGDNTLILTGTARIVIGTDKKIWTSCNDQEGDFYVRATLVFAI